MENSSVKSGGNEISKKSRSLDIRSLYKSRNSSNERKNHKRKSIVDDNERDKEKRKSKKEASQSSAEQTVKKSRSSLDETRPDLASSVSKPCGILFSLNNSGNALHIPKRPRGSVGRKKFEGSRASSPKGAGSVGHIIELDGDCKVLADQVAKSNGGLKSKIASPKLKEKNLGVDDTKKSSSISSRNATTAQCGEVEEKLHLIVSNDIASSSRKRRSNNRKRKRMVSGSESLLKKVEHITKTLDSHEEDEENLEQNAARMLSSRFDPSCTRFSLKSESTSRNRLSPSTSSDERVSRGIHVSAGTDLASGDAASRKLRPRKKYKGDGELKHRRYFYGINYGETDTHWVLNRRIKIFWPLDKSWYYGLVSEYCPETKLHHIKYDDRDEEWIDLQNEKFRLLLLPSEVPHKTEPKGAGLGNKLDDTEEKELPSDDGHLSSDMDSEPLISWLSRSSRQVKPYFGGSKRHKTSQLSPNSPLKLSTKSDSTTGCIERSDSLEKDTCKSCSDSALLDRSSDISRVENSHLSGSNICRDGNLPVVYVRRRFQKKDRGQSADKKTCENVISAGIIDSMRWLWSVNDIGLLKLNIPVVEPQEFRVEVGLPVSTLNYIVGVEESWLIRALYLCKYGTVMTMWPKVHMQILFVDNGMGLRFLLFEGSLKQAVGLLTLVLEVFLRADQQGDSVDMLTPVTSIRFRLSCVENTRKQHVIAFYRFSEVKRSKWLYLNSRLQQHCLLAKQLPLSECTYDNIKALESNDDQLPISSSSRACSLNEDLWKESMHGIVAKSGSMDYSYGSVDRSSFMHNVKHVDFLPFALSFSAAPSFFVSLHLKLLMENNLASISHHKDDSVYSPEHSGETCHPSVQDCTLIQEYPGNVSKSSLQDNSGNSIVEVESSDCLHTSSESARGAEVTSECGDVDRAKLQNGNSGVAKASSSYGVSDIDAVDAILQSQEGRDGSAELKQLVTSSHFFLPNGNGLSIELPSLRREEIPMAGTLPYATLSSDLVTNMGEHIIRSPKVTGPRLVHRSHSSLNSSFGNLTHMRPDEKPVFGRNGFGNGPKKPRTQVQYTLPSGGLDLSSKSKTHNYKGLPFHRIRKSNDKRASEVSKQFLRNLEALSCDANVLITVTEKGWRECGARIELERADHNEWKLTVKLSGITKYSYNAHQFLQPGSTNRYTHAMMWRGGKDWVLEFPDRSQWMLFKEMYEECFNRNLRAASVKNIPIPGVCLIEDSDDVGIKVPFIRSSPNYLQQVESDAEMAMDPAHVLYDMDSDDETWILEHQKSSLVHGSKCEKISEELLERTMDMFEKVAYAQQRDDFRLDEIEEFMSEVGPMESIQTIYEHWRRKRLQKGMPLIRHFQPPLWERYQQQVKEWEQEVAKASSSFSSGHHGKVLPLEKPPMFAFCLKPRGLELPNKISKQRSHRRMSVSGNSYSLLGDHDSLYANGRRSNGYALGDEKFMYLGNSHEYSDTSPTFKPSTRVFSPRHAGGNFGHLSLSNGSPQWDHHHHPKLHGIKLKKTGGFKSPSNVRILGPYSPRTVGGKNGFNRWNTNLPRWPNQRHYQTEGPFRHGFEQLDGADLDEFRLRDASGAAQHARNMARLKREKAQRLLYRADLAIHKAVVALMTAEAIKGSSEELNSDDSDSDESTDYDTYEDDDDDLDGLDGDDLDDDDDDTS